MILTIDPPWLVFLVGRIARDRHSHPGSRHESYNRNSAIRDPALQGHTRRFELFL